MDLFLPAYAVIGILAGVLAGLMGIGGGLVIVPALLVLFRVQGVPADTLAHQAVATSLATIMPIGVSSAWAHHKKNAVDWRVVSLLAPGLMLGALAGVWLATQISTVALQRIFGVFLLLVTWQMFSKRLPQPVDEHVARGRLFGPVGLGIGGISALVGIGGGTMTVPFLVWRGKALPQAVATSAACGIPIALAGTLGFVFAGRSSNAGLIDASAALVIGVAAIMTTTFGARLAHQLPVPRLRKLFALVILVVALRLLLSG